MIEIFEDIGELIFGNKRMDALGHFAKTKQFAMRRRVKAELLPLEVQAMQLFRSKGNKSIKGFLYKRNNPLETLAQIFDCRLTSDFGNKVTTVFLFECKKLDLPRFSIRPKGSFGKLGSIFSSTEWSEVNKAFDHSFEVETSDDTGIHMIITIQFTEVMLSLPGYTVEGNGDYLLLYKKNQQVDIIDMDNIHASGLELVDIVLNDYSDDLL